MTNKTELLPCPFCGSTNLKTVVDDGIHFEQCCKCEATGPTGFKRGDEDDADWNTRAAPAEDVRAVGDEPVIVEIDPDDRHLSVLALHDVMQSVPCSSLYSLAEAVLDAGYTKAHPQRPVVMPERRAVS